MDIKKRIEESVLTDFEAKLPLKIKLQWLYRIQHQWRYSGFYNFLKKRYSRKKRLDCNFRDRSKITSHNLFAKVPKRLDILQTECEDNVFPFL